MSTLLPLWLALFAVGIHARSCDLTSILGTNYSMLVTLSESSCIMRFETAVDESLSVRSLSMPTGDDVAGCELRNLRYHLLRDPRRLGRPRILAVGTSHRFSQGHLQFLIDPLEQKLGLDRGISNAPRPLKNLDPKRADGTWLSNLQLNWTQTVMDHPNQVLYVLNNKNFVGVYAFNATHNLDNKEDWRNIFGRKADEKQLKRGNYIEDPYSDVVTEIFTFLRHFFSVYYTENDDGHTKMFQIAPGHLMSHFFKGEDGQLVKTFDEHRTILAVSGDAVFTRGVTEGIVTNYIESISNSDDERCSFENKAGPGLDTALLIIKNEDYCRTMFSAEEEQEQCLEDFRLRPHSSALVEEASIDPTALLLWLLFIVMVILTILVFALYRLSVHNARKYLDEQDKAHFLEQQAGTGAPCYNNRTTLDQSVDNWPAY